jgi:hypothetical protein
MSSKAKQFKDQVFNEPMVVFPPKQYENLMDHIEEIEDRLAVLERETELTITQPEAETRFREKFGEK